MDWAEDFTYAYYKRILAAVQSGFVITPFLDVSRGLADPTGRPACLLRHDVDMDLELALSLARIEHAVGVSSCYMVMTNCPLYSLDDAKNKAILNEIVGLGHELGLHYDFSSEEARYISCSLVECENDIDCAAQYLESVIGQRVYSVSFHKPLQAFLQGPLLVSGRINAYSAELMQWYLSDSRGRWRNGEPLLSIVENRSGILQLLSHPIWWGEEHLPARNRLQVYFDRRTVGLDPLQRQEFDESMQRHISLTRSGIVE